MKQIVFPIILIFVSFQVYARQKTTNERANWVQMLDKISRPVIYNLANDNLKASMPQDISVNSDNPKARISYQYLEALGRTLSGIAPWLQAEGGSKEEIRLRDQYRKWVIQGIGNATDSTKKDFMIWDRERQPLVDAAFFALGLIRAPWIWEHLPAQTKNNVVNCLVSSRKIMPYYSNWLLFSGVIEAFFCKYGYEYDAMRMEYGINEFMRHWYVGDGMFSDGQDFHLDYYNSYVIQPFLQQMVDIANEKNGSFRGEKRRLVAINQRYAEIQERSINADGSFPLFGRSIVYRTGAFHHLANMSLLERLPKSIDPGQAREALNAVIQRNLTAPGTFDKNGWLVIGLLGAQPSQSEGYITQGSLYLCTEIFLPLGLNPESSFWSAPAKDWSSIIIWSGQDHPADHAL